MTAPPSYPTLSSTSATFYRLRTTLLAVLIAAIVPIVWTGVACGQVMSLASVDHFNRKIAGCVVDHTNNHGADHRIHSAILGQSRDLYVYLPPGYSRERAYPFLLYMHMANLDEHVFIGSSFIAQLDRMIQRGDFPPVVVACPDGVIDGRNRVGSPHSFYVDGNFGAFQTHLVQEVIPFLFQHYSLRPEREAHAVLGLSAGGFGALSLALKHRELFGSVATLAGPANMRYDSVDGDGMAPFDPATYRWNDRYDPDRVVGRFYLGLKPVRASRYIDPIFGSGEDVDARIRAENPADLIFSTNLQPGQLSIYLNFPGKDNYNFDDQARSFAWLAASRGVSVTLQCAPGGRHNLAYFRNHHVEAYCWLSRHLLPPTPLPQGLAEHPAP